MNTTTSKILLSLAALIGATAPAVAEVVAPPAVAAIKTGAYVRSSDGRRLGAIDTVDTNGAGAPVDVQLIVDSHIVRIPAETITVTDKFHVATTMSYKDVMALSAN